MSAPNQNLREQLQQALELLANATDQEILSLISDGFFDRLLSAIASPQKDSSQIIYDYLLENRDRLTAIARLHLSLVRSYPVKGILEGKELFVSPSHLQWYDDGVMFLQGERRFEGNIGLYKDGNVKFAIAARDTKQNDQMGPDDILFVDVDKAKELIKKSGGPKNISEIDSAVTELTQLIHSNTDDEKTYQDYLIKNPWVLGAQYRIIQSHLPLDDQNIPDITGVRTRDGSRDIIEIKQPFLPLFREDGRFRAAFNDAWNQAERYLDFTRRESDYLFRQKHLRFDNARCYLIIGYNLTEQEMDKMRAKERMNSSITILTYNDLVAMAKSTADFIKKLME